MDSNRTCYYVFTLPLLVCQYAKDLLMPGVRNSGNSECIISFNDYDVCWISNYFIPIYKNTDKDTGIRIISLMTKVLFEPRSHSNIIVL